MRRLVIAGMTALAACAGKTEAPMWGTLDGKAPLVIAHRGASGYLPEHTLEAYALAIDQGADVVEPDLVFTKDGVLVARHDRYLSTTTDIADHPEFAARKRVNNDPNDSEHKERIDWWIEDFTLAEVKTLRARQPFPGRSKEFDGLYEIPTFDEMLALVGRKSKEAGRPVGVYPETKHPAFFASIGHDFEKPLLAALQGFDAGPVFIQSFEPEILKRLKGKTDAKLVQLVYEATPGAGTNIPLEEIATYADGVGAAKSLQLDRAKDFVADAAGLRLFVHFWTFRSDAPNEQLIAQLAALDKDAANDPRNLFCKQTLAGETNKDLCADGQYRPFRRERIVGPAFEFEYYFSAGADGVFTDFPDAAVTAREKRQQEIYDAVD